MLIAIITLSVLVLILAWTSFKLMKENTYLLRYWTDNENQKWLNMMEKSGVEVIRVESDRVESTW